MDSSQNLISDWVAKQLQKTRYRQQSQIEDPEFYRKIASALPNLIYVFNIRENENIFFNRRVFDVLGYTNEEIQAMGSSIFIQTIHPHDLSKILDVIQSYTFAPDEKIHVLEFRAIKKNGQVAWLVDRSQVFRRDNNGVPIEIIGVVEDITEVKLACEMLEMERARTVYNAKMVTLGQLSGQVAHEINNPLTIILGRLDQMRKLVEKDQPNKENLLECISKMESTTDRIARITKGLRSLSRNGESDPLVNVSLKSICDDVVNITNEKFRAHQILFQVEEIPQVQISCQPVQLSQILLNLLQNSFDAIETKPHRWIRLSFRKDSDWVILYVTDSGEKIDPIVASEMMKPFFTTKPADRGTGLGLSISQEIAAKHGGQLAYESDQPYNRFSLKLPIRQSLI